MLRGVTGILFVGLIAASAGFVQAQTPGTQPAAQSVGTQSSRMPQPALTADQLEAFLKTHKGPVLDVRDNADCDVQAALKRTTHRLTFAWAPDDPEAKKIAHASFVTKLRTERAFVQVNRNQTPVLVVCCGGMRSQAAVEVLARNGFNVVTLNGGILTPLGLQPTLRQ